MKKVNPHYIGVVLGATVAAWHVFWSLLVFLGWAGPVLDFVFSLHFLSNPYTLQPFDFAKAIMLWVMTFVVGYVLGWIFAMVWNMTLKK